jgi:hypothetical protein
MSQPGKRSFPWHWIVLGLLVAAQAGLGAYSWREQASSFQDVAELMILGVLLSQPIPFALWAAFAPQSFFRRLLCSFLLCTLLSLVEVVAASEHTHSGIAGLAALTMSHLAILVVATAVLSIVRSIFHWRITRASIEAVHSDYRGNQFGVKHLLILTTIIAVGCGLLRSLVITIPHLKHLRSLYPADDVGMLLDLFGAFFMAMCVLIPALVIPWYALAFRPRMLFLIVTTLYIWVVCGLAAYFIMRGDFVWPMLFIQLGAALSVLVTSLVMRFCGFRLARVPKAASVR